MVNEFEDDAPNVAGWEPTLPQRAPEATVEIPDTAQNVIAPPTRTWASIANDYADIYSDAALSTPAMPPPQSYYQGAASPMTTLRNVGSAVGDIAELGGYQRITPEDKIAAEADFNARRVSGTYGTVGGFLNDPYAQQEAFNVASGVVGGGLKLPGRGMFGSARAPKSEPKTVRLYRAEPSSGAARVPELDALGGSEARGRWFTGKPEDLKYYLDQIGADDALVRYADVPVEQLDQFRVANVKEEIGGLRPVGFSGSPEMALNEFFLPRQVADNAKRARASVVGNEIRLADEPVRGAPIGGGSPLSEVLDELTPRELKEVAQAADETVRLFRGAPAGQGRDTARTTGNALFYSPDESVARSYAGKTGEVVEDTVTFRNLLRADTWVDAKQKLGGLEGAKGTMAALIQRAREAGYDGITFKTKNGQEYIRIPQAADELTDPVKKFTELIKAAKPARAQTEVLKSQELSRRVARAGAALDSGSGEQAFIRAKSQLSGQLPVAQFDAPRPDLTPDDVASLYNQIRTFPKLRVLEKINTETALTTALAGQIPTRGQLAHLETVFGSEMVEALLKQRSLGTKVWEATLDALNMPRTLVTSVDLSAPFRQGAMMIGHPKEFAGAITPMVKAFAKERYAREVDEAIAASPFAQIKSDVGLYIAPLSRKSAGLGELEEAFMSRALQRGPIKGSQQAYVTFLNKLRSDVFDNWWTKLPEDARTIDNAKRYAAFINAATGRGSLPQAMNGLQPLLNATLFSPRYFVSRLQASGMGAKAIADVGKGILPGQHVDIVSKQIAGDYLKFLGTVGTVIGLASLAGANVETDPRSSDFMKIRVGSTRYDILAGNQQIFRNATNFVTGERKALKSGDVAPVGRNDVILNFIRSKLAPIPSLGWDIGAGSTMLGEEVTPSGETLMNQAWNRLVPFVIQDIRDGAEQEGGPGMFKALPSFFGVGAQSFDPPGATGGSRPARPTRPSRPSRPRRPSRPSR